MKLACFLWLVVGTAFQFHRHGQQSCQARIACFQLLLSPILDRQRSTLALISCNPFLCLQEAHKSVQAAKKEAKAVGRELNESLAAAESLLIKNLTRAEKENATVYLQRIPNFADLPKIVPAPLVKPIAPTDLGGGDGLFTNVIPDSRLVAGIMRQGSLEMSLFDDC